MTNDPCLRRLQRVLDEIGARVVACSGGVDSLLLATVAHRRDRCSTKVAHTVSPAVPADGTARVLSTARREGWQLELVRSGEFDDERYLSNPTDRCYYCKTSLYDAIGAIDVGGSSTGRHGGTTVVSGANVDDLSDFRPGLRAADEHGVRHPFVEAGLGKAQIRSVARSLGMDVADLPASPCLASRLYTGTRVTPGRLHAIEVGEAIVRRRGAPIVRCRIDDDRVTIEVPDDTRAVVTQSVVDDVHGAMRAVEPSITSVTLDARPYRAGRAVIHVHAG